MRLRNGRRETILVLCFVVALHQRVSRERRGVEQREQPGEEKRDRGDDRVGVFKHAVEPHRAPRRGEEDQVHDGHQRARRREESLAFARAAGVSPVGARRARHHAQQKGLDVGFRRERERAAGRERHRRRAKRPLKDGVLFFRQNFFVKVEVFDGEEEKPRLRKTTERGAERDAEQHRRRNGEHRREQRVQNIALIVARLRYYACFRVF
mmetsp:Transcript_14762/g.63405  ORF Transcript_14762/g.63405 Transcript_14762/m.63405 type:complete len:209 (-) Transcript_14762:592-1218(-)